MSLAAKSPSRIAVAQQSLIKNAAFVAPIQAEQIQEIELLLTPLLAELSMKCRRKTWTLVQKRGY